MNRHELGLPPNALVLDSGLFRSDGMTGGHPILLDHVQDWCRSTLSAGRRWTEWVSVNPKGAGLCSLIDSGGYLHDFSPMSSNTEDEQKTMTISYSVKVVMPVIHFEDVRDMVAFRLRWAGE